MNWADFFAMGGYAFYVWSAWGLTFVAMLWQWVQPTMRRRKLIREIKRQMAREQHSNLTNPAQ